VYVNDLTFLVDYPASNTSPSGKMLPTNASSIITGTMRLILFSGHEYTVWMLRGMSIGGNLVSSAHLSPWNWLWCDCPSLIQRTMRSFASCLF
jgi:hypothetical protein